MECCPSLTKRTSMAGSFSMQNSVRNCCHTDFLIDLLSVTFNILMKNLKKTLLVCGLLSVAVGVFAQDEAKTLPVLREGKEDIHIWVDGRLQPGAWLADPRTRPDVYPTSGRRVKFANERDSVVFDVEKDGAYDFVVLTAEGDSAFTRVQWESANPLEEPSAEMLRRGADGKLSKARCGCAGLYVG